MKTTRYFEEQVLRKRPYILRAWCEAAISDPLKRVTQPDGRIRSWVAVTIPEESRTRYLRVILLEDSETVHNAFLDRDFEGG